MIPHTVNNKMGEVEWRFAIGYLGQKNPDKTIIFQNYSTPTSISTRTHKTTVLPTSQSDVMKIQIIYEGYRMLHCSASPVFQLPTPSNWCESP